MTLSGDEMDEQTEMAPSGIEAGLERHGFVYW